MLDLRLLQTFVAIVDAGSFTAAGERLSATQSTVSQQLGRLEQAVGRILVDRAARPSVPTAAGERLLGYARRLLALQDEAEKLLSDPAGTAIIRIGVPDDVVTSAMSRQFARFAERHREVRLDMTTGLSRTLFKRFREGEFDVVIVKEPVAAGDARATFPEPLAWFEATGHQGAWPDPVPLVTFPPGGLYRDVMIERIERSQRRWYIAFTGSSLSSVLSAVEAGLGVSVLPVSTTGAHAVRAATQFAVEAPLVVSVYAWEMTGALGELVRAMIETISRRHI